MSQADAAAACNDGFASLKDLLSPDQFNSKVQNCISDMVNTGDNVWLELDVQLAQAVAIQNAAAAPATTKAATTTQKQAPPLPPACSNTVTSCGKNNIFIN